MTRQKSRKHPERLLAYAVYGPESLTLRRQVEQIGDAVGGKSALR
jgi:hypothetical protein